ncbi:MAG: HAD-IA family hydrolase [Eubacteriales bacterium]
MEEMYIYRLGNAFRDYGKIIDGATALQFQSVYEKHQHNIRMTGEMEGLLEKLSKKTTLGIITNGPSEHQRDKVRALGLERWIPMERIWISGDLGIGKPHKEIFAAAQDKLGLKPEELCFVGDAYGHDILGARGAGWKAVWFNHRRRQATGEAEPDYEVRSEQGFNCVAGKSVENPLAGILNPK